MKKENGITLISLVVTVVVLILLTFTITGNIDGLNDNKKKAKFEEDMNKITQMIDQYYARYKRLPVLNQYINITMLKDVKNVNENANYYVIDIARLGIDKLNYGGDYTTIESLETTADVSDYLNVYIINAQSHTVYYPQGIEYNGKIHYTLEQNYTKVSTIRAEVSFSGETEQSTTPVIQAEVNLIPNARIVATSSKWILNNSKENLGTDADLYENSFSDTTETIELELAGEGNYYLHILVEDKDGEKEETIAGPIAVTEKERHVHTGNAEEGGGCYTTEYYTYTIKEAVYCSGILKYTGTSRN